MASGIWRIKVEKKTYYSNIKYYLMPFFCLSWMFTYVKYKNMCIWYHWYWLITVFMIFNVNSFKICTTFFKSKYWYNNARIKKNNIFKYSLKTSLMRLCSKSNRILSKMFRSVKYKRIKRLVVHLHLYLLLFHYYIEM